MLGDVRSLLRGTWHLALISWAVALGAGLGLGSVWWMVERDYPFGERRVQAWTAWPSVGAPDSDPYARAIIARSGEVPLALGEGIAFHAAADDDGRPLDGACDYEISGPTPIARAWTLTLYDPRGQLLQTPQARTGITSAEALRDEAGGVTVALAPRPRPGNWLQTASGVRFQAVLRLYDSQVGGIVGWLGDTAMPRIVYLGCGGRPSA